MCQAFEGERKFFNNIELSHRERYADASAKCTCDSLPEPISHEPTQEEKAKAKEFWEFLEKCAKEVESWPQWKKDAGKALFDREQELDTEPYEPRECFKHKSGCEWHYACWSKEAEFNWGQK